MSDLIFPRLPLVFRYYLVTVTSTVLWTVLPNADVAMTFEIFPTFLNKTEIFRWNQLVWRRSRKSGASTLTWASIFDPTVSSSPAMLKGGTSKNGFWWNWKMQIVVLEESFLKPSFLGNCIFCLIGFIGLIDW